MRLDKFICKSTTLNKQQAVQAIANSELLVNEQIIVDPAFQVHENNIIDPTLVIKSTIQNAIGAATMIFTTDCIVIREED